MSEPLPWASARRAGTVAIYTRRSSGTPATDTYYVHRDHQGSPELVTNTAGVAVTRFSFSGYGARRDATDWSGPISSGQASLIAGIGRRGYTDHEHLDAVGLVHMNGRVYEPLIGRFLSRDPRINETYLTQAINGYAYVHNSPLSFVDPTGYEGEPLEEIVTTARHLWLLPLSLDQQLLANARLQPHIGLSFGGGAFGGGAQGGGAQGGAQGGGPRVVATPTPTEPIEEAPKVEEVVVEAKKCVAGGGASRVDAMIHSTAALSLTINTKGPALDSSMIGSTADRLTAGRMQWAMRAAEGTTHTMGPKLAMFAKRAGAVGMIYTAGTAIEKGGPYLFYAAGDIAITGGLMLIPPPANFWAVTIYAGSGGLEALLKSSCD